MGVERFEDLIAWKRARELTQAVDKATRQGSLARDYGMKDQMQRASVSVMSNIAKGFERGSRGEFAPFPSIAKASCLYAALDAQYLDEATFQRSMAIAVSVGQIAGKRRASVAEQPLARLRSTA